MVRNYEPSAVDFLIYVGDEDVDLAVSAVLQFQCPTLLAHLPSEIAIDVNVLV
jgi:hypothetical protein